MRTFCRNRPVYLHSNGFDKKNVRNRHDHCLCFVLRNLLYLCFPCKKLKTDKILLLQQIICQCHCIPSFETHINPYLSLPLKLWSFCCGKPSFGQKISRISAKMIKEAPGCTRTSNETRPLCGCFDIFFGDVSVTILLNGELCRYSNLC